MACPNGMRNNTMRKELMALKGYFFLVCDFMSVILNDDYGKLFDKFDGKITNMALSPQSSEMSIVSVAGIS